MNESIHFGLKKFGDISSNLPTVPLPKEKPKPLLPTSICPRHFSSPYFKYHLKQQISDSVKVVGVFGGRGLQARKIFVVSLVK